MLTPAAHESRPRATRHDHCLGCGARLGDPFLDLGETPLANRYLAPADVGEPEWTFRLAVAFCSACCLVQLTDLVSPEVLFSEYPYLSSYSDTFVAHAREMAAHLTRTFCLEPGTRVLEIASNDGYLLKYFKQLGMSVLGVEPAANIADLAERSGIPTLRRFFSAAVVPDVVSTFGRPRVIIGNNVLAHVPDVNAFLAGVRACLDENGVAVFEAPHVKELLERAEFDTIYHEHVFYYSLHALVRLAGRAGLAVFDVERQQIHGGSLRVFLQPAGAPRPVSDAVRRVLREESSAGIDAAPAYSSFGVKVEHVKRRLLALLGSLKSAGKSLAAYGAPAKGNTLLNYCGIGNDLLSFTVDRSPHKQGKVLPGSRLPILPPEALASARPDFTLILPWNLTDEIVRQQDAYLRSGGRFIVPVPEPHILPWERAF